MNFNRHKTASLFDDWAANGRAEEMEKGHYYAALRAFHELRVGPNESFLDVGCGNGYAVRWAIDVGAGAHGIDVSPTMIEHAKRITNDALAALSETTSPEVTFAVAAFPYLDAIDSDNATPIHFDAILAVESIYYIPDLDAAAEGIRQRLRSGGRFAAVLDFYSENKASHEWTALTGVGMHLRSIDEWQRWLNAAGLTNIRVERWQHPGIPGQQDGWQQSVGSLFLYGEKA